MVEFTQPSDPVSETIEGVEDISTPVKDSYGAGTDQSETAMMHEQFIFSHWEMPSLSG